MILPRVRPGRPFAGAPRVLGVVALAWGLFLGASSALRVVTFQGEASQDAAAVVQMLYTTARGEPLAQTVLFRDGSGPSDRSHFDGILFLLAPLSRLFPGPLPWFVLWALAFSFAAVPLWRCVERLTGSAPLAWAAACVWWAYPHALKGVLCGLRPDILAAALLAWAIDAATAGRIGRFAWWATAVLLCREDAFVLVGAAALPLAIGGPGGLARRALRACVPLVLAASYAVALGLVRVRVSEFVDPRDLVVPGGRPDLFRLLAPALADLAPGSEAWAEAWRSRVEVVRSLAFPAFLPALAAPEWLLAATPVVWALVFWVPNGLSSLTTLSTDHYAYHLAGPLLFAVIGAAVGLSRLSAILAAVFPRLRPTAVPAAALATAWTVVTAASGQGPLGADPWDPNSDAADSLACWSRHPRPPVSLTPGGILDRVSGPAVAACSDDAFGIRDLAARVPPHAAVVTEKGWAIALNPRYELYVRPGMGHWQPRFQERVDWALLAADEVPRELPGRWVRVAGAGEATLWRRQR